MQLRQFNIRYDPREDRLVLRLNTADRRELRFFLTRRFVGLLWPVFRKLLHRDQARRNPAAVAGPAAEALVDFERERVMAAGNFREPFAESPVEYPLGETPVLLTRIQVKSGPDGDRLCLHPDRGAGVEFPARPQLLHTLTRLVRDAALGADWKMDLPESAAPPPNREGVLLH